MAVASPAQCCFMYGGPLTPSRRLYEFDGAVISRSTGQRHGLDSTNLLLRGCTLRKTQWVVGLVVFAGGDTKVQQNGIKPKRKVSLPRPCPPFVLGTGSILCSTMALNLRNECVSFSDNSAGARDEQASPRDPDRPDVALALLGHHGPGESCGAPHSPFSFPGSTTRGGLQYPPLSPHPSTSPPPSAP